jgi:hypothetical protein
MPFLGFHEIQGEPAVRGANASQVLREGGGRLRAAVRKFESELVEEEAAR